MDTLVSNVPNTLSTPNSSVDPNAAPSIGGGVVQHVLNGTNDGTNSEPAPPVKRKPGRPKGSGKKQLLSTDEPKIKRPVGRPRKDGLPAGSVGPRQTGLGPGRPRKTQVDNAAGQSASAPVAGSSTPQAFGIFTQWRNVQPPAIVDPRPLQPTFAVDPNLDPDDWGNLIHANPNNFLHVLLASLAAPNPVSSAGPTVEEAFKSHLVSLAPSQAKGGQSIPTLYSILKTFWLPSSPAYFSLTASASTARTPSEHRFLYWDPQPLVFNGIACPSCSTPLMNRGRIRSGPIKVYDLERPFFVIGCEYVCKSSSCVTAASPEGRKFASTDPSILRSLPAKLKDEFPAHLMHGDNDAGCGANIWNWKAMGVSRSLWNMVRGALQAGLGKNVILELIHSIQYGVPDEHEQRQDLEIGEEYERHEQVAEEDGPGNAEQTTDLPVQHSDANDAYNNAWKANSAVVNNTSPHPTPEAVHTTAPAPTPAPQPTPQPAPPPHTFPFIQASQFPTFYAPYANQPAVAAAAPSTSGVVGGLADPHQNVTPQNSNPLKRSFAFAIGDNSGQSPALESVSKRAPRHCCKCGSQDCKGKGGRSFCMNACQDCGKLECKGRNSRRPDKSCAEAWS